MDSVHRADEAQANYTLEVADLMRNWMILCGICVGTGNGAVQQCLRMKQSMRPYLCSKSSSEHAMQSYTGCIDSVYSESCRLVDGCSSVYLEAP